MKNIKMNDTLKLAALGFIGAASKYAIDRTIPLIKSQFCDKYTYRIRVSDDTFTDMYHAITSYLNSTNVDAIKRNIKITDNLILTKDNSYAQLPEGTYTFIYNKCMWRIEVGRAGDSGRYSNNSTVMDICITGPSAKLEIDKIMKYTKDKLAVDKSKIKIESIYSNGHMYGGFKDKKTFDSIFSSESEYIKSILSNFKEDADYYKTHGLIHKLGILLYGSPGTGKTSTAQAIASYLGYRLLIVKASSVNENMIHNLNSSDGVVVLFEDIDCTIGIADRTDNNESGDILSQYTKSMSFDTIGTLLNFMDGVNSPNNVVFVGTTNHIDKLDEAILRKSRFDYLIEMGDIDRELAIKMCNKFRVDYKCIINDDETTFNPSELQFRILDYRRETRNKRA